ncbi:PTS sugar transporter subunit IIB [Petroclostridium sp. X23]|uniref:PTS sugar transporter subunit IIB n=1 Tax=Petroclostridium sp. X23 TaxID=3045146 RepID=UPI0024ACD758|nr:PTS sugar transporter subunit IIB [Petroclostridium sp. X23]WHH60516.1 PTS sugar transporter subunit IIB [Petroclostridium sp. X23]
MLNIRMARIDDRLMHGQILFKWLKSGECNRIIVIDDETSADPVLQSMLHFIFPKEFMLDIYSIQEGIEAIKAEESDDRVILLAKNLFVLSRIYEKGIKFEEINIGRIPIGVGRKKIYPNVFLSDADIEIIRSFQMAGLPVKIQMVPDSEPFYITDIDKIIGKWSD